MAKKQKQVIKYVRRNGVSTGVKVVVGTVGGAGAGAVVASLGSAAKFNPYVTAAGVTLVGAVGALTIGGAGWKAAGAGMAAAGVTQGLLYALALRDERQRLAELDAKEKAEAAAKAAAAVAPGAEPPQLAPGGGSFVPASFNGRRAGALTDDDVRRAFRDVRREMAVDDGDDD
jgi:hypothetical protein